MFFFALTPFQVLSDSEESNLVPENILIIYDNSFDNQIVEEISKSDSSYNYTIQSTNGIANISDYLFPLAFDNFSGIVLVLSTSINEITDDVIIKFQDYLSNSRSLTIISSKIWQLPLSAKQLLGIEYSGGSGQEFIPNQMENYTLTVNNNSYFQKPDEYSTGSNITMNTKLGIIHKGTGNVFELLTSNSVDIGNNTVSSGIYAKENHDYNSSSLSIPISLLRTPDTISHNLITNLVYSRLESIQTTEITTTSITTTSNNFFPRLDISPEITGGAVLLGTATVLGVSSYKVVTTIKKKEEDEVNDSFEKPDIWTPDQSIFFPIISFFLGIFSIIGAIIYSQRYKRLSVFQVNENPIRAQIVDILEKHEFEHFNSLQKKLNTGVSILLWHLKVMEDFEIIKMEKIGQYKIIYLFDHTPDPQEVHYYCNIRTDVAFSILKHFLDKNTWSLENLSTLLSSSPELIKYHCSKLVRLEILYYDKINRSYSINSQKVPTIKKILDKHKQNGIIKQ